MPIFIPHKSFNFTEEEYNNAKMRDELPCTCEQCGKQFMRLKRDVRKVAVGIKNGMFCSSECSRQHQTTSIKTTCSHCSKEIIITKNVYEKSETKHFFCNHSCSASYSNSHRIITDEHKENISNTTRKKYKEKTGFSSSKEKKQAERVCKICGQNICQHPEICKSNFLRNIINLKKIGFNLEVIGTKDIYQEYYRIQRQIFELYHIKQLSILELQNLYEIKSERTLELLFKFLKIETRDKSTAQVLAVLNGKNTIPNCNHYKYGWHTSWENKEYFYRSSYEEDYMNELDKNKISYDGEIFRIPYFNTDKNTWCVAIPDIYLPDTKTIVEIKSNYTYDKQEMIDKSNEYKRLGFNFKLVLEHIEYDYCV